MRIAYVFASLNPGGSEKQQADMVVRLRDMGHDVAIFLPYGPGVLEGNLSAFMKEHQVNTFDLWNEPEKIPALQASLETFMPDVVVSNGYPMTINGSLAAYRAGVPLRIIRYENTGFTRQEFPQAWHFELAGHLVTQYVVGNSQAVVDSLSVYNGIDGDKGDARSLQGLLGGRRRQVNRLPGQPSARRH
jgi:hypothetical protein